jgi:hypothetical protein
MGFVALPLFFALVLVIGFPLSRDGDLWLHLKTGQSLVESLVHSHRFPYWDVYTYTELSHPTEIHSWLGQVVLWLLYRTGGEPLIRGLHGLLLFSLLALTGRFLYQKTKSWAWTGFGAAWILILHRSIADLKPSLFAEFFFTLFCLIFFLRRRLGRWEEIALFGISALWINLHGTGVLAVPLSFCLAGKLWWEGDQRAWRVPLLVLAGSCLNPLGPWVFERAFAFTREVSDLPIFEWQRTEAIEWANGGLTFPLNVMSGIFIFLVGGLGLSLRHRKGTSALLLLASIIFPWVAVRHRMFLILPLCLAVVEYAKAFESIRLPLRQGVRWAGGMTCLFALLVFGQTFRSPQAEGPPEHAVDFLAKVGLSGNVFTDSAWGGYLLFRLFPEIHVGMDCRASVHAPLLRKMAESMRRTEVVDLKAILKTLPTTDYVLHRARLPLQQLLGTEWIEVYENPTATIFLKRAPRNEAALQRIRHYYETLGIPFSTEKGFELRQAYLDKRAWAESNVDPPFLGRWPEPSLVTQRVLDQAEFYYTRNLGPVAVDTLKNALLEDEDNPLWQVRLGQLLVMTGRKTEARAWLNFLDSTSISRERLVSIRGALR